MDSTFDFENIESTGMTTVATLPYCEPSESSGPVASAVPGPIISAGSMACARSIPSSAPIASSELFLIDIPEDTVIRHPFIDFQAPGPFVTDVILDVVDDLGIRDQVLMDENITEFVVVDNPDDEHLGIYPVFIYYYFTYYNRSFSSGTCEF